MRSSPTTRTWRSSSTTCSRRKPTGGPRFVGLFPSVPGGSIRTDFDASFVTQFDEARKRQLAELQAKGEALCREKAKLQHQIEHVTWHLEGCRRRRPCLARLPENCPLKGDAPSCIPHSPEKLKIMVG